MENKNLLLKFESEIIKCLSLAEEHFGFLTKVNQLVAVKDISTSYFFEGRSAGIAKAKRTSDAKYMWKSLHLKFNSYLIHNNYDSMVSEVIPHEIAHLITYMSGDASTHRHSKEWQEICIKLGGNGKRYHNMKTLNKVKKIKYYIYYVDSYEILLEEKDHKKAQKSFINFYAFKQMRRIYKENYSNNYIIKEVII